MHSYAWCSLALESTALGGNNARLATGRGNKYNGESHTHTMHAKPDTCLDHQGGVPFLQQDILVFGASSKAACGHCCIGIAKSKGKANKAGTFSMSAALAPGFSARTTSRASNPNAVNAVHPLVARGTWGDLLRPPGALGPLPCRGATSAAAMSGRSPGSLVYCLACTPRHVPLRSRASVSGIGGCC